MKTKLFDLSKRKFFLTSALALASLKLAKFMGADQAMAKTDESSSKSIAEEIASLKHELTRLQDVNEIMKLQARYETIHATDENLGWMLFADRPDTSKEITAEKIIGFENIKGGGGPGGAPPGGASPAGGPPSGGPSEAGGPGGGAPPQGGMPDGTGGQGGALPGGAPGGDRMGNIPAELQRYYNISTQGHKFTVHPVSTPCIEVAADGKTAKGTYTSLGFEGDMWCYGKYANDYIKIDGRWYIWHMKWLRCFKAPYEIGWADQTIDQIYEFTKGEKDADGNPKVNPEINYDYLLAPNKPFKTITVAKPYKTWTEEDEDGGWWKKETTEP